MLAGNMSQAHQLNNKNALAHFMRTFYYSSLQTSRMADGTGKGWSPKGTEPEGRCQSPGKSCKEDEAMDMPHPRSAGEYILERLAQPDFPWLAQAIALPPGFSRGAAGLRGIQLAGLP